MMMNVVVWALLWQLCSSAKLQERTAHADSQPKTEFILSGYCGDDYTWAKHVDCSKTVVYVYNKCTNFMPPAGYPQCAHFHSLPNVGRESETFLHHLVEHYESLAQSDSLLIFLQGAAEFDALDVVQQYEDVWRAADIGFASLEKAHCAMMGVWSPDVHKILTNLHSFLHPGEEPQTWVAAYRGQFMISARRARRVPKWFYEYNRAFLRSEGGSEALYGHAYERFWTLMFGCTPELTSAYANPLICRDGHPGGFNKELQLYSQQAPAVSQEEFVSMMLKPPAKFLPNCLGPAKWFFEYNSTNAIPTELKAVQPSLHEFYQLVKKKK